MSISKIKVFHCEEIMYINSEGRACLLCLQNNKGPNLSEMDAVREREKEKRRLERMYQVAYVGLTMKNSFVYSLSEIRKPWRVLSDII